MHGTRKKFRRKIFYDNITIEIARTNNIPVTTAIKFNFSRRSRAGSNRRERFCRPVPRHSAT